MNHNIGKLHIWKENHIGRYAEYSYCPIHKDYELQVNQIVDIDISSSFIIIPTKLVIIYANQFKFDNFFQEYEQKIEAEFYSCLIYEKSSNKMFKELIPCEWIKLL